MPPRFSGPRFARGLLPPLFACKTVAAVIRLGRPREPESTPATCSALGVLSVLASRPRRKRQNRQRHSLPELPDFMASRCRGFLTAEVLSVLSVLSVGHHLEARWPTVLASFSEKKERKRFKIILFQELFSSFALTV